MCGTVSFARARAPLLHRHTAPMCGKTRLRRTVFSLAQVLGMWRGHYTRARHVRSDTNAVQAYFTGANTTGSCGTRTPQAMPHTCCRPTRKRNTKRMSAGNPRGGFPFLRASHFLWHPVGGARPRSAAIIHEERHAAEPPSHPKSSMRSTCASSPGHEEVGNPFSIAFNAKWNRLNSHTLTRRLSTTQTRLVQTKACPVTRQRESNCFDRA